MLCCAVKMNRKTYKNIVEICAGFFPGHRHFVNSFMSRKIKFNHNFRDFKRSYPILHNFYCKCYFVKSYLHFSPPFNNITIHGKH